MPQSERVKHGFAVTLEISILLIIPVLIFTLGVLPPLWRYSMMEAALAVVIVLVIKRRVPWARLGLRRDNFWSAAKAIAPGTLLITALAAGAYELQLGTALEPPSIWWNSLFFVYYWLIAIVSQQFAFMGFGVDRFRTLGLSPVVIAVIIGALFSFLHSHHVSPQLWIATFVVGTYWAWQYQKNPNLFAVALSHAIIGTVAIMLGFV